MLKNDFWNDTHYLRPGYLNQTLRDYASLGLNELNRVLSELTNERIHSRYVMLSYLYISEHG